MLRIFSRGGFYFQPVVFLVSTFVIIGTSGLAIAFHEQTASIFAAIQDGIATNLGWHYIQTAGFLLGFSIWMYFSKYGEIRLGSNDSRPEFSNISWFSMLFSAGMGIGLVFYGVAEPMTHFLNPPVIRTEVVAGSVAAARRALQISFFHWGLHAWAIYAVLGLALAYYGHRKGLPLSVRSVIFPFIGKRIYGNWGNLIDTFAVVGTMFGIATSLGLGVMQINAGLDFLHIIEFSLTNQILLIAGITFLATISVMSGVDKGIKWLSNFNIGLAILLLLFVFVSGPTLFILRSFVQGVGDYLQNLVSLTFWTSAYQGNDWQKSWTLFYWAWWIAWAPFVGMFIARVSKGRTIKEFTFVVLLVPTLVTFIWMTVFGNTAIHAELEGSSNPALIEALGNAATIPASLFIMINTLPFSSIIATLATILIITFFVTSSDSGSFVIDILTSGGHPNPPAKQRLFWAVLEGVVASSLLIGGGLVALQTAAITTALPLSIILLVCAWGLVKSLRQEKLENEAAPSEEGTKEVE